MKTGSLLIGVAVVLGVIGITMPDANRTALMIGAGISLALGLFLMVVGALIANKKKSLMLQFQGAQGTCGIPTDFEIPENLDTTGILKTVMDAQADSGGDPEELEKLLRERFGGQVDVSQSTSEMSFGAVQSQPGDPSKFGGVADASSLLSQLSEMRDQGIITDEQYETQKKHLLDD